MKKVFLGGTCNGSTWREKLIPLLKIDYFNPVVDDWTPECQAEEIKQRQDCDYCLYVITPKMMGVYSVAEVVDDSNKRPNKAIFCMLATDESSAGHTLWTNISQIKSLEAVGKLVESNGGKCFESLKEVSEYLNTNAG